MNVFWVSVLVAGTLLALGAAALLIAGQTRGEGTPGPDVTDPVADERLDAVLHAGEPIRGQTTEMERGTPPAEGPRPAEPVPASRDEPAAPSADEPSRPGVHIFDMSDPGTPREIAFYNEEEAYDLTRPLAAGPRTGDEQPADQDADATPALETPASVETPGVVGVVDTEAKAASASAAGSESGAATAAAAIVAAEQRAIAAAEQRAIAAAEQQARAVAKAAAKAATWSARRRASRPATRPGVTSEKRDRGD